MEINDSQKIENFVQLQLFKQIFDKAVGDSPAFAVVMESLTKAMVGDDKNVVNYINEEIKSNDNIEEVVEKASKKFSIDKDLIKAVIKQESDFDPSSTSTAGAMGLMQLMPGTAEYLGVNNPYDIEENVNGGTKYLRELLDVYGNRKELALAAYNAGPGTLQNRDVKEASEIERLPHETRDYVKKVMKYYGK
ncbi:lytic transglycosylase domain-containing protein [uncultured Clostridium sp.]|uniref:lytic transglycosylase domain-containing protein n=1 Tax=uncultured Clostridium sp. TaxID=59620 RepID=UPI0028EC8A0B|nr:lytic transglycosylase domain-containing protein [uncultured Clostridium sp.]